MILPNSFKILEKNINKNSKVDFLHNNVCIQIIYQEKNF